MSKERSTFRRFLYCILGIAFLIYSGYIVGILIMHIWIKGPHESSETQSLSKNDKMYQDMLSGVEKDHTGKAVKDINGVYKLYDFHKTDRKATMDTQNTCVSCHGDVPHDKKKQVRAFLNMHAYFMACETCHVRAHNKNDYKYVWYEKANGKEHDRIDLTHYLGDTPYKLMPLKKDGSRVYDTDELKNYVAEFKKQVGDMPPSAKSASLKIIHRPMTDLKNTVKCEDCHNPNAAAGYLPFTEVGYPARRAQQLIGNEVSGMVNKYKKFYMPDFLKPNEDAQSEK